MTARWKSCRDFSRSTSWIRTTSGSNFPVNGEGEPLVVPRVTQSKTQALQELRSLSSDQKWLAKADADLAD
jgi:hypothetical protein